MSRGPRAAGVALAGVVAGVLALLVAVALWLPGPAAPGAELAVVGPARAGTVAADAPLTTLLLAPLWAHLGAARAYELTKVVECVAFALAAIPAFFLARPLLGRDWALGAAAASVLVPAATATAVASPLPLAYPVTTVALLAFVRFLERRRTALLALALGAAALAAALWPAVGPLAVVLAVVGVAAQPWSRSLLRWPGAAAFVALAVAAYVSWSALVASSEVAAAAGWEHGSVAAVRSVGAFVLGLGVLAPLAAVSGAFRRSGRAVVVTAAAAAVALVPAAGVLAAGTGKAADDRPLLVLVPPVLALAAAAIRAGATRALTAAGAAAVLLAAALVNRPRELRAFDPTVAGLQWLRSGGEVTTATLSATVVLAFVLAVALILLASSAGLRRAAAVVALAVPVPAAAAAAVSAEHRASSERLGLPSPPTFLEGVDGSVGVDEVVPPTSADALVFWNGDATILDPPLAARTVDPGTGVYEPLVTGLAAVLTPDPRRVRGAILERTPAGAVVSATEPLGAAETVTGVYPDGWSGPAVTYRRFQVTPRATLEVTLSRRAFTGPAVPDRVTVALGPLHGVARPVRRLRVPPGATRVVRLDPPARPFRVELRLDTFSPARFGSTDTRELGAQTAFDYGG